MNKVVIQTNRAAHLIGTQRGANVSHISRRKFFYAERFKYIPDVDYILTEEGDFIITEDGDNIVTES